MLGEDRDVAAESGGVAGDVRHRAGPAVDDLLHDDALGALAGRVEHDEVERLVEARAQHPVGRAALDGRRLQRRQVGPGVLARGAVGLHGDHPGTGGLADEPGEQPDAGVEVERALAGLGVEQVEHRPDQDAGRLGVHLPEAVGGDGERVGAAADGDVVGGGVS